MHFGSQLGPCWPIMYMANSYLKIEFKLALELGLCASHIDIYIYMPVCVCSLLLQTLQICKIEIMTSSYLF